jgi:Protein of unknown function (DUF998)
MTSRCGLITIATVLYWLALIALMHVLEPEFSPMHVPMSAYVAGAYGGWMTTTFFALATALTATAFGLCNRAPDNVLTWIALLLFIVAAFGVVLAGIFPGIISRRSSIHWHGVGSRFAFPGMALGSLLFSLGFFSDPHWRRIAVPALALSGGGVLVFLLWTSPVTAGLDGLMQRVFFAFLIPWIALVGFDLIRFERAGDRSAKSE